MNTSNYTTPFWVQDNSGQSWTLSITPTNTPDWTFTVQYSINGVTWSNFGTTSSSSAITKNFTAGQKVYLRATTNHWGWSDLINDSYKCYKISSNKNFSIGGNIMSLIYGSTFVENGVVKKTYPDDTIPGIFNRLFSSVSTLIDASELVFPVTHSNTIGNLDHCHKATFNGCTNLVNGPHIDLRAQASNDLPYCFQNMFQNCSKLESVYFNTQGGNYRYNAAFSGTNNQILTLYNYSGTSIITNQENRATLYQGFDRVTGWESSVGGDLNQVNGTNNVLLWKKYNEGGAMDSSVLEDIYENADKTFPSAPAAGFTQMVKNINASPMTITFTCRNQSALNSHAGSFVTFEYYIADGEKQTIVFDADHKKYTDMIPAGECCFYNNYSVDGITSSDISGLNINRSWIMAKCSDFYILKISNRTVSFEGDWNLLSANASSFSGDKNNVHTTWNSLNNGYFRYFFSGCRNLLYPPTFYYSDQGADGCYAYYFYNMFSGCVNLKQPIANIRIPKHYNHYMCAEMYKGCENLTNVDNAFLFGPMGGAASTFVNRYASTSVPSAESDRFPFSYTFSDTFYGCIKLTSAKFHLPCVRNMHTTFSGTNPYAMNTQSCFIGMFSGCRRLDYPPKIECEIIDSRNYAYATLPFACYQQMYFQCYNLQEVIITKDTLDHNAWSYNSSTGYFEDTGVSASIDFITIGANPYYGEPGAKEDNQTGNYYKGDTANSYMPALFNGWTRLNRVNWWE